MARPAGLLEIGHIRRAHGVRGEVFVELGTDRPERVAAGARWCAARRLADRRLRPPAPGPLARHAGGARRPSAAQRFTNTAVYAEPLDDPDELWVHELIGSEVVEVSGRSRGTCVAVVANPAADLLELDSGALVPVVFVTERRRRHDRHRPA